MVSFQVKCLQQVKTFLTKNGGGVENFENVRGGLVRV